MNNRIEKIEIINNLNVQLDRLKSNIIQTVDSVNCEFINHIFQNLNHWNNSFEHNYYNPDVGGSNYIVNIKPNYYQQNYIHNTIPNQETVSRAPYVSNTLLYSRYNYSSMPSLHSHNNIHSYQQIKSDESETPFDECESESSETSSFEEESDVDPLSGRTLLNLQDMFSRFQEINDPNNTQNELSEMVLNKIPIQINVKDSFDQCPICQIDFSSGDMYRNLPCKHKFHSYCIDKWFEGHITCPICRANIEDLIDLS